MRIDWGGLRRISPISKHFGFERGTPVDRYYVERFLASSAADIFGRVLEIGDDVYTTRFGRSRVTACRILDVSASNPKATIVADLSAPDSLPPNAFDCAIVTQTLQLIYDVRTALKALRRSLRTGGVLLATIPGVTPMSLYDQWYWSFTQHSVERLCAEVFQEDTVTIKTYGNALAATCFLEGIALEELDTANLDVRDPAIDVLIAIKVQKALG